MVYKNITRTRAAYLQETCKHLELQYTKLRDPRLDFISKSRDRNLKTFHLSYVNIVTYYKISHLKSMNIPIKGLC